MVGFVVARSLSGPGRGPSGRWSNEKWRVSVKEGGVATHPPSSQDSDVNRTPQYATPSHRPIDLDQLRRAESCQSPVMPNQTDHLPGEPAPVEGVYCLLNVFGTMTGKPIHVRQGERLPLAPLRHTWRLLRTTDRTDAE